MTPDARAKHHEARTNLAHLLAGMTSEERLAEVRHPALRMLRRIGPAFPSGDPEGSRGMRGVPRRATKSPFVHGEKRRRGTPVTATCLNCQWSVTGRTWRPVRRRLAEHTATKHRRLVAATSARASRSGSVDLAGPHRPTSEGVRAQSEAPGRASLGMPAGSRSLRGPAGD